VRDRTGADPGDPGYPGADPGDAGYPGAGPGSTGHPDADPGSPSAEPGYLGAELGHAGDGTDDAVQVGAAPDGPDAGRDAAGAGAEAMALFMERLRAELGARQDVLGISDTAAPRLVIVIDRVHRWAVTAPSLLAELTALLGGPRPAGVHVLLGVTLDGDSGADPLDLELCATAGVRVALRLPDTASSRRVIGVSGAELLDDPGRGYVRLPDGAVVPFRGARISGRMPSTNTLRATVQRQNWRDLGSPRTRHATATGGPTDFALLAGTLTRTATQLR
jgi:S-DNA-T family DNA segregation ATPase FtsK/SpoIIIE